MTIRYPILLGLLFVSQVVFSKTWPNTHWPDKTSSYQGHNPTQYTKLLQFIEQHPEAEYDGLVVIKKGHLAFEWYREPVFAPNKPHIAWSVTKSFVNALIGIALKEKKLRLQDSICSYGLNQHCAMTIQDLLSFSSGLAWKESYEKTTHIHQSDVINMLFSSARQDILSFVIKHPLEKKPGTQWYYSSGDTNLLTGILHHLYSSQDPQFPFTKLLNPMGISTASWQQDGKGVYIGSSHLYMTPRDLARFGYLFLMKGRWNNTQLFDQSWIDTSIAPPPNILHYKNKKEHTFPAHHWWVNSREQNHKTHIKWPDVPTDAYYAYGHHGQVILVIPSKEMVIVKTANDRDRHCDHNQLFKVILNYLNPTTLT